MNAPEAQTLLTVNDLFVRLVQALKGEVIRELLNSGIVGSLQARVDKLENGPVSSESLRDLISTAVDEKLDNYDPTDHDDFEDEVKKIIDDYQTEDLEDKMRDFIRSNVSVDIEVSR